jgi:putative CocE/NonD family hydrolase
MHCRRRSLPQSLPQSVRALIVLAFAVSAAVLLSDRPAAQTPAAATSGVALMRDVMVPMRDGVRLATDIYLPTNASGAVITEKIPTILERTPYNKVGSEQTGRYFAAHGYAFVSQDTRGRYASEGVWQMLTDDGRDGADVCDWIGRQTWSNGSVGTLGTSYVGGTQHAIALEKAPNLKTAIPADAMSNLGYQSLRNAGAFELRFWNWIYTNSARGSREARDRETAAALTEMMENRRAYLLNLPLRRGTTPLKLAPEYEEWLVAAMKHGANDDFWAQNDIVDHPDHYKDIPVYLIGGWYDSWAGNTSTNYKTLSRAIKGPVYLIMGPWIHGQHGSSAHGQVSFGKDAAIADPLAWRLEWFDRWLKGMNNSVGRSTPFATPVRIFVMGGGDERKGPDGRQNHGGYWRDEREWPLARTQYTKYYFHQGGGLSTEIPADAKASASYAFDPSDPVPTIGGNISSAEGIMLQGAWDQRGGDHVWNGKTPIPLSARRDVVVFQTEPLANDIEVTGEIEVKLWASSSAVDTDFTAKLVDVHPPNVDYPAGVDMNLEDGIVRARFRDSLKQEKLMEPGTTYEFTIKLYPTSNVFGKGHRIRVDVSSSNFPRFDVNPNTGEPLNEHRRTAIATNTIYFDRTHPSHIVLPVIPMSTQTTAGR